MDGSYKRWDARRVDGGVRRTGPMGNLVVCSESSHMPTIAIGKLSGIRNVLNMLQTTIFHPRKD